MGTVWQRKQKVSHLPKMSAFGRDSAINGLCLLDDPMHLLQGLAL
jgi:hypothetical protein